MAGHGGTVSRRTANKKTDKTILTIAKALTKTTNCTFRAKKSGRARPKKIFRPFASDECPPPPLSNSFRRRWPLVSLSSHPSFCRSVPNVSLPSDNVRLISRSSCCPCVSVRFAVGSLSTPFVNLNTKQPAASSTRRDSAREKKDVRFHRAFYKMYNFRNCATCFQRFLFRRKLMPLSKTVRSTKWNRRKQLFRNSFQTVFTVFCFSFISLCGYHNLCGSNRGSLRL